MMRGVAAACAAIMIFASPADAQSQADQPVSSQVPAAPALPPNFVPPPPARLYDNYPRRSHHGATGHHATKHEHAADRHNATQHHKTTQQRRATKHQVSRHEHDTKRNRSANARTKAHHGTTERHRQAHEHQKTLHLSKRTIRQCQDMSYKQIMRHSNCRALMKQELESADRQHSRASRHRSSAKDHSSAHHRASTHHARSHRDTAHRRSAKRHRD